MVRSVFTRIRVVEQPGLSADEDPDLDAVRSTVARRLRFDAGRSGIADWESQYGALTSEERAAGLERVRTLLSDVLT